MAWFLFNQTFSDPVMHTVIYDNVTDLGRTVNFVQFITLCEIGRDELQYFVQEISHGPAAHSEADFMMDLTLGTLMSLIAAHSSSVISSSY